MLPPPCCNLSVCLACLALVLPHPFPFPVSCAVAWEISWPPNLELCQVPSQELRCMAAVAILWRAAYLFISCMGSLTTFLSPYNVIAAKTLDRSAIRPQSSSSMLLEIFNCLCAFVKHCSFVSVFPLCWESMLFKSWEGDAWKLAAKRLKISRVIPVTTVSSN